MVRRERPDQSALLIITKSEIAKIKYCPSPTYFTVTREHLATGVRVTHTNTSYTSYDFLIKYIHKVKYLLKIKYEKRGQYNVPCTTPSFMNHSTSYYSDMAVGKCVDTRILCNAHVHI